MAAASQNEKIKNAKKKRIKHQIGDIFRMKYDRTRYCYGIIIGDVIELTKMPELPEDHSLRTSLLTIPIIVRYYQLITDNPNLGAGELKDIPLGPSEICASDDIYFGVHDIISHKQLTPEDLDFNFVFARVITSCPELPENLGYSAVAYEELLRLDAIEPAEYFLYVEWGFTQTRLEYDQMTEKLKELLNDVKIMFGGARAHINPENAVSDTDSRNYKYCEENYLYKMLTSSKYKEISNEIFTCLGIDPNTTFDLFAEKFNGLSKKEILALMKK